MTDFKRNFLGGGTWDPYHDEHREWTFPDPNNTNESAELEKCQVNVIGGVGTQAEPPRLKDGSVTHPAGPQAQGQKFLLCFEKRKDQSACEKATRQRCEQLWNLVDSSPYLQSLVKGPPKKPRIKNDPDLKGQTQPEETYNQKVTRLAQDAVARGQALALINKIRHDEGRKVLERRREANRKIQLKSGQKPFERKRIPEVPEQVKDDMADATNTSTKELIGLLNKYDRKDLVSGQGG